MPYTKAQIYKKLIESRVIAFSLIIIIASLLSFILSVLYFITGPTHDLLFNLGITGVASGVVSIILDFLLVGTSKDAIEDSFEEKIAKINDGVSTFKGGIDKIENKLEKILVTNICLDVQLKYIFLNRNAPEMKQIMINCMDKSREIKMIGTSLRRHFTQDVELRENLEQCARSGKHIKILIANPFTKSVAKRTILEEGIEFEKNFLKDPSYYTRSETYTDVESSLNKYENILARLENVKFKCYNDAPSMYLVITDDCAFFEAYQYGRVLWNRCIGENFLVQCFGRGQVRDLLVQHFDFIWNDKSNLSSSGLRQLYLDTDQNINNIMRDPTIYWRKLEIDCYFKIATLFNVGNNDLNINQEGETFIINYMGKKICKLDFSEKQGIIGVFQSDDVYKEYPIQTSDEIDLYKDILREAISR